MSVAAITLRELTFPDITGRCIKAWGQIDFTAGTYVTGGLPMGLLQFADDRTIDFNGFLQCNVWDEEPQGLTGLLTFHYSPVGDVLQIYIGSTELANGAAVPISDSTINPDGTLPTTSPRSANLVLFEATWDRTSVRG